MSIRASIVQKELPTKENDKSRTLCGAYNI